jgi:hypothetical protein
LLSRCCCDGSDSRGCSTISSSINNPSRLILLLLLLLLLINGHRAAHAVTASLCPNSFLSRTSSAHVGLCTVLLLLLCRGVSAVAADVCFCS